MKIHGRDGGQEGGEGAMDEAGRGAGSRRGDACEDGQQERPNKH